jgi:hypothetical protein
MALANVFSEAADSCWPLAVICDSCARAKSTRYVRRKKVRQAILKQSKRDFVNVTDIVDDESSADDYEADDVDDELDTSTTTAVTVGRLRDIAKAQPLSNTISIIFTDLKGPFKTAGLGNEISLSKVTLSPICVICWMLS